MWRILAVLRHVENDALSTNVARLGRYEVPLFVGLLYRRACHSRCVVFVTCLYGRQLLAGRFSVGGAGVGWRRGNGGSKSRSQERELGGSELCVCVCVSVQSSCQGSSEPPFAEVGMRMSRPPGSPEGPRTYLLAR